MKFLADECFDARLVTALRDDGHDVLSVRESMAGADDSTVLQLAYAEGRVLLTEDTDFGELVYRLQHPARGVILLRLDLEPVATKLARLRSALQQPERVAHHFVVVGPQRTRIRPLP